MFAQKRILSRCLISSFMIVFFFLILYSCKKNNSIKEKIDGLMDYCYENDLYNGTVLVAHKGKVIYQNAFGYSDFETKKPLKLKSQFCLGSLSKPFTAMAIMILKERNRLKYEDKLSTYFPEFPDYANQVTIKYLLTHAAGITNWMNHDVFRSGPGDFIDDLTNKDVFNFLIKQKSLDFAPGEKYVYSNGGYVLLAMIVEKASGEPFHVFMKKNIFDPLGMKDTAVFDESKPEIRDKVIGYDMFGDKDDANLLVTGDGGIYSTAEDVFKWERALYTEKLVTQKTLQEAFTPNKLNNGLIATNRSGYSYGYGWVVHIKDKINNAVFHDGGLNGFSTMLYRELNNQNAIIFLTNKGSSFQSYPTLEAVLNILHGEPMKLPTIPIIGVMNRTIAEKGMETAFNEYHELKKANAAKYDFSEGQLNGLGYRYLNKQKYEEAKAIFKLNVEIYPDSSNAYDSYGEACMGNGEYDEAIKNYKRSLELNPDNTSAVERLRKINDKMIKK